MDKIRVRFAPSPTGYLHIGGLRSALYNYLFAKKHGGTFILRIEDTDRKRHVAGALESLIKSLEWAGLEYDEGVYLKSKVSARGAVPAGRQGSAFGGKSQKSKAIESKKYPGILEVGEHVPYIQSERLEIYRKYAEELVKNGKAYYCFCPPERLEEIRKEQIQKKLPAMYDKYCLRSLKPEQINENLKNKCPYTIRLKVPADKIIKFDDIIRGKIEINSIIIDDQILLKSDGYPTYHLANVVDDHLMKITHVIRGEEWLSSTPKHILLYEAFGWEMPKFAHLPLLLNPDRSKLSKRQGDVSVGDYFKKGYLKEAVINFVALLGWNPGKGSVQEIFSLGDLVKIFDLEKVHKAGAVVDSKKLDWLNSQYIKKLSIDELYKLSLEFFERKDFYKNADPDKKTQDYLKKVLTVERERITNLSGVGESSKFFFQDIKYEKELLSWKNMAEDELKNNLEKAKSILEKILDKNWTLKNLEAVLLSAAGEMRGQLLWPLRVALTGEQKSPSPFEVAWVLGREETIRRIKEAINLVK